MLGKPESLLVLAQPVVKNVGQRAEKVSVNVAAEKTRGRHR